tara:strand:+ start:980 stop:1570 length:591 start_codon:yes stop_codon:yes gene_type:complete
MNYGELKSVVAEYIHRSDLTAMMPTFVEMAHARIMRDVRVPGMLEDSTLTVGSAPVALPAGFLDMRELSNTGPVRRYNLKSVGRAQLNEYTAATGGLPIAYSIIGNKVEIQPAADATLRIIYFKRFAMFVDDTDTNSILELNPYLYIYSVLIEANSYIQDTEQRAKAVDFYTTEYQALNAEALETRYGEAPQIGTA